MSARPEATAQLPYKTVQNHAINLQVWLPKDVAGPVPAIVWIHGGGLFDGASADCSDANVLPSLAKGWAFVSLDYRLVPQVKLDDQIEDCTDGIKFVIDGELDKALGGGKINGTKVAVSGSSAGGMLALLSSYRLPTPPAVVFALYPVADLTNAAYRKPVQFPYVIDHSEISHHLDPSGPLVSHSPANVNFATMDAQERTRACFWAIQEGKTAELATGTTDLNELKKYVAKTWVGNKTPPTVVIHGTGDIMVPCEVSTDLVQALQEKGVDSLFIPMEGANHAFDLVPGMLEDPEKKKVIDAANDFVAKYLA